MPIQPSDIQVLIPYKDLVELLEASRKYQELEKKFNRLEQQQSALRGQFLEMLDKFREIE